MIDYVPLRKGYTIQEGEKQKIEKAKSFENSGLIKLGKVEFAFCKKCGNKTIVKDDKNQLYCSVCSTLILSPKREIETLIEEVKYKKIIDILSDKLTSFGLEYEFDKSKNVWYVNINQKLIPVFLVGFSIHNLLISCSEGKGLIGILLDRKFDHFINKTNSHYFLNFQDILKSPETFQERLKNISHQFNQNYSIKLENKFDSLMNNLSDSDFEIFVETLLKRLKHLSNTKLQSYYEFLNMNKNKMENSKVVILGGSGNPDFKIINLLDYLTDTLKPEKFGECKKFYNTILDMDKYGKAIAHSHQKDTLFVLSTNEISPSVWMNVFETKEIHGYHKYSIIDKDLLLTLIQVLKIEDILEKSA